MRLSWNGHEQINWQAVTKLCQTVIYIYYLHGEIIGIGYPKIGVPSSNLLLFIFLLTECLSRFFNMVCFKDVWNTMLCAALDRIRRWWTNFFSIFSNIFSDRVAVGRALDLPVYFGDAGSREVVHITSAH